MTIAAPPRAPRPRVVYFINAYDHGGAELGLLKLVEGGLFRGTDLTVVAIVTGSGSVQAQLSELGCRVVALIDRPRMRTSDLWQAFARFRRLVADVEPAIVVASLPQANIVGRLGLYLNREITFVSFEHNTHLAKPVYEALYRLTSSRVDWVFADAEVTLKTALERLYLGRPDPSRRHVVPLIEFHPAASLTATPRQDADVFHLINAARFTDVKNQAAIISAVALLRQRGRAVRLTLYGDGGNRPAYERLVNKLGIAQYVDMPGFVADWPSRAADGFVLASRHEGLCIVLLEAMHAGIPVAAPLIGGIKDYGGPDVMEVADGVTPEALAAAVARMLDDPGETGRRAARAAETIDRRYGTAAVRATYRTLSEALRRAGGEVERVAA